MIDLADDQYPNAEILARLEESLIFQALKRRAETDVSAFALVSVVLDCVKFAHDRAKIILSTLPEYTLHDSDHLFRVLGLMGKLLALNPSALERFSAADLTLCILSSFFHDIGLAPTTREVQSWRNMISNRFISPKGSPEGTFSRYLAGQPQKMQDHQLAVEEGREEDATRIEDALLGAYIRTTHGVRCKKIISDQWGGKIKYGHLDLVPYLSFICESHTLDTSPLLASQIVICSDNNFCSPATVAVLLRLADLLDFDSKRAPKALFDSLDIKDGISVQEWSRHQAIKTWTLQPDQISVTATCSHPMIEESVRGFCDTIEHELVACIAVLSAMRDPHLEPFPDYYRLKLPSRVDRSRIRPMLDAENRPIYRYKPTRFELDRDKIIDLLMGTSLYGQPAVALRELLQNSIDACSVRKAFEEAWGLNYSPEISVVFERTNDGDFLVVEDNGMGMDEPIISQFYAKVGASFYRSAEFHQLKAEHNVEFTPISRFGIGVLSYFLVATHINVISKRLVAARETKPAVNVKVNSVGGLFWIGEGARDEIGTVTTLALKPDHPWRMMTPAEISNEISKTVPEPPFPISLKVRLAPDRQYEGQCRTQNRADLLAVEKRRGEVGTDFPDVKAQIRTASWKNAEVSPGVTGDFSVSWLEQRGQPVTDIGLFSTKVVVDGTQDSIDIENSLKTEMNAIVRYNTSLDWKDKKVVKGRSYFKPLNSSGAVILHGIRVPVDFFDDAKAGGQYDVFTQLPFVLRCVVSIRTPGDLNLNAARSDILADELWYQLKGDIVRFCLNALQRDKDISASYFRALIETWRNITNDQAAENGEEPQEWLLKLLSSFSHFR